jgi:hypothetical protein
VAMLALKPAFVGEKSSARALDLAEWTATKDFFEYCSVLEVFLSQCKPLFLTLGLISCAPSRLKAKFYRHV